MGGAVQLTAMRDKLFHPSQKASCSEEHFPITARGRVRARIAAHSRSDLGCQSAITYLQYYLAAVYHDPNVS